VFADEIAGTHGAEGCGGAGETAAETEKTVGQRRQGSGDGDTAEQERQGSGDGGDDAACRQALSIPLLSRWSHFCLQFFLVTQAGNLRVRKGLAT